MICRHSMLPLPMQIRTPAVLFFPSQCGQGIRAHRAGLLPGLHVLAMALSWVFAGIAVGQSAQVTFDIKIEKGQVAQGMRLLRVKQGDAVRLRWTSDRSIVLHLHGYDIERKVQPGAVTDMAFTAHATGRFPIEEHKPDARGSHSHGEALVRIEVRPR